MFSSKCAATCFHVFGGSRWSCPTAGFYGHAGFVLVLPICHPHAHLKFLGVLSFKGGDLQRALKTKPRSRPRGGFSVTNRSLYLARSATSV